MILMSLNTIPSGDYDAMVNTMNNRLSTIAAGIQNLPATIATSLENLQLSFDSKPIIKLPDQLDHRNFEKVNYWTSNMYQTRKKKGKAKGEEDNDVDLDELEPGTSEKTSDTSGSCYMEDENGKPIPESRRGAARTTARGFWIQLLEDGLAPTCLTNLNIYQQHKYIRFMEDNYPWLRYCEDHWKSLQIWRGHYITRTPEWLQCGSRVTTGYNRSP